VSDLDASRLVQLDVEVQPLGQDFVDQPGYSSALVASGAPASVTIGPLGANSAYHWQARARDAAGATSPWVSFPGAPGNAETEPDFNVQPPPVRIVFTVQPSTTAAGDPITPAIEVTALDANDQVVTGFGGRVTVTIAANPGKGKLSGTTTVTAGAGVATFVDLRIDKPGFGYTLQAATASPVFTTVSAPFIITRKRP
jgi:hypothetical protein